MSALRPYQARFVADLTATIGRGVRRVVGVAPTGSGKGTVAAYLLAGCFRKGKRALFVVHRREIINDIVDRVAALIGAEHIGVMLADDPRGNPSLPIQVASIDTLRHRTLPAADLVVIDEAHRSKAASYKRLFDHYQQAVVVGLTATPWRLDGKGLRDCFDEIIVFAHPSELIEQGFILAPVVYQPKGGLPDLRGISTKGGDFDQDQLSAAVNKPTLVGSIVEHWQRLAGGRLTVVAAVNIDHSKTIVARFREAGVAAEHVDGKMSAAERADILYRFRKREFPVLVQCQILVEGIDIPAIKCVVLARPTKSVTMHLQFCGRALRPSGDETVVILDHAGNTVRLGFPQDDREWTLDGKPPRSSSTGAPIRTCDQCYAIAPAAARVCPGCGAESPVAERALPREVDGELVEVKARLNADLRETFWKRQCEMAQERGHNRYWAVHRYRERFNENPPEHFAFPEPVAYSAAQKKADMQSWRAAAVRNGLGREWVQQKYRNKFGEEMPDPSDGVRIDRTVAHDSPEDEWHTEVF